MRAWHAAALLTWWVIQEGSRLYPLGGVLDRFRGGCLNLDELAGVGAELIVQVVSDSLGVGILDCLGPHGLLLCLAGPRWPNKFN